MLSSYLTIIFRKLRKERMYAIVNLSGLSVGFCAFLLIVLFVKDELSYDNFHKDRDQIYRVLSNNDQFGYQSGIASDYIKLMAIDLPQVNSFTRISRFGGQALLESNERKIYSDGAFYVDKNFFSFFDFELLAGQAEGALEGPDYAVISENLAKTIFGDEDPIGKEIVLDKTTSVIVNAVSRTVPANSYIKFDLLISEGGRLDNEFEEKGWLRSVITYLNINKESAPEEIAEQLTGLIEKPVYRMLLEGNSFELMPLTEQRLTPLYDNDTFGKNDIRFIYLFSGIGLVILLLALMNYTNLTTAQSLKRSGELGLRKVIGASRRQLIGYHLLESTIITTIGLILAFAMAERLMPLYNQLLGKGIVLNYGSLEFLVGVPVFGVLLGTMAGVYPAMTISRVKPLRLVNKQINGAGGNKNLRRVLVLTQFVVAGCLLITTLIMQSQMSYLKTKDLGFDKEHLITIPLYNDISAGRILKQEVSQIAGVESLSLSSWRMGNGSTTSAFSAMREEGKEVSRTRVEYISGDKDYVSTMRLRIKKASESYQKYGLRGGEVVISEGLADEFGWGEEALGMQVFKFDNQALTVIAVVEDFHSRALKTQVLPTIIILNGDRPFDYLEVRVTGTLHQEAISQMKLLYENTQDRPFQYFFVDDEAAQYYKTELGQLRLFSTFSVLAIFIAVIGLVALTTYMTQQRQKEVSIRKVLGASMKELLLMLNKEHTWLTIIAFAIATPLAVYAMQEWLASFKYRIDIQPTLFVFAMLGFVALNIITTLVYTLRVSRANPANTLRNE